MSVLDKFMDMLRLNDDDYDEDYYGEDFADEEYDEEPKQRKNFFKRSDSDSYNRRDDEPQDDDSSEKKSFFTREKSKPNVTPIRTNKNMGVCVMKPKQLDDSREIITTLLTGKTVILNLEGVDLEISQRVIDFTSGAAFAIDGRLQKISSYIFLVTPPNVEISGDLQDLFSNGSLDNSSVAHY